MANVLLVEDDDYLREAIKSSIEDQKHNVVEAPNGKVAREILGTQKFDAIISDIQMPYLNGVELLEWVNQECPTPFVLMTGFSNLLETQSAYDLGAKEFLTKPFRDSDLVEAIKRVLEKDNTKTEELKEDEFCKVSINEFVARPKVDFDVYIKLSSSKYIKLGHAGCELPKDQIEKYKQNSVNHLYIKRNDFSKLVDFNLELGKILQKNKKVPKEKKINFMKYTGEVILEKAFVDGVDKESFDDAKDFLSLTVSAITEEGDYCDLLGMLNNHSDYIYAHSVGVSMYAVMIARKLGFEAQNTFFKLSMAGLFHDIGKKEIDREILEKSRPLLSLEERQLIESHPARGREILLAIPGTPSDVVQLVYEHHEDCAGQGFPQGLNKTQMHPLSKILQLANIFVEQTLVGPHSPGKKPKASIEYIESVYLDRVDRKCLNALQDLFGLEVKRDH